MWVVFGHFDSQTKRFALNFDHQLDGEAFTHCARLCALLIFCYLGFLVRSEFYTRNAR